MTNRHTNIFLRKAREARGWKQSDLAEKLGVTPMSVGRWERGDVVPSRHFMTELSHLFSKTPQDLGFLSHGSPQTLSSGEIFPIFDPMLPLSSRIPLIGRHEMLSRSKKRLFADGMTHIALNGLPGAGKTALAIALAYDPEIRTHFADGILWAGMGPTANTEGILSRWGSFFSVRAQSLGPSNSRERWAHTLRELIGQRRLLIVLDDAWNLADALTLKVGGENCAYVLTTRLPALAADFAQDEATQVTEMDEEESIELLNLLAPELTTITMETMRTLVHTSGGLPLALTLAGKYLHAQAYQRPPRRLHASLERLLNVDERLSLSQPTTLVERHPSLPVGSLLSLHTLIAVSDEHLDPLAQSTLRALSVFPPKPNTFSEEAAMSIAACPLKTLDALTDVGLLESSRGGRYTLHQTIADYARTSFMDQNASQRFITYYVTYIEENMADFEALELESTTIFTALEDAHRMGNHTVFVRGVFALTDFLLGRGLYDLGKTYLQHAYEAIIAPGDVHAAARILSSLGMIAQKQGEYLQATSFYEEGLAAARQGEDQDLTCALLSALGWVTEKRGSYIQAEAYIQEGLILAREINNDRCYGTLLRVLGTIADSQGNSHDAKAHYQEALTIMRQYNDQEECTILLINLGIIHANEGAFSESTSLFEEALAIARQMGLLEWQCLTLLNLGALMRLLDENQRAFAYCEEGLKIARQIGHREWQSHLLNIQAVLISKLQGPTEAEPVYQEALALAREIDKPVLIAGLLGNLGQIALRLGDLDHAAELFSEMMETIPEGSKPFQAEAFYNQGLLAAARGERQKAYDLGISSMTLFEEAHLQDERNKVRKWLAEGYQPLT
jgi:tetratricopeptide (TPR) repeat protein/transcriptional regulator with XRE-family HTH domain